MHKQTNDQFCAAFWTSTPVRESNTVCLVCAAICERANVCGYIGVRGLFFGSVSKLLRSLPPEEQRSFLGAAAAAAAAAPPAAAAHAPFSCSSPLLLVRLLFFPLLFFWLGILRGSDVSSALVSTYISGSSERRQAFLWTPFLQWTFPWCDPTAVPFPSSPSWFWVPLGRNASGIFTFLLFAAG